MQKVWTEIAADGDTRTFIMRVPEGSLYRVSSSYGEALTFVPGSPSRHSEDEVLDQVKMKFPHPATFRGADLITHFGCTKDTARNYLSRWCKADIIVRLKRGQYQLPQVA